MPEAEPDLGKATKDFQDAMAAITEVLKPLKDLTDSIGKWTQPLPSSWFNAVTPDPPVKKPTYTITIDRENGVIIKNTIGQELLHYAVPIAGEWGLGDIIQGLIDDVCNPNADDDDFEDEYEEEDE